MTNFANLPDGFQPLSLFDQAFAATQNAANLTSGTVGSARLPLPTLTAIGAIKANAGSAHQWVAYIDTTGTQQLTQPAFSDLSGSATSAQLPTPTTSNIGGVKAVNAVSHQWVQSIDTTGTPQLSQPAFSDLSGTASAAQIPPFTQNGTGAVVRTYDAKFRDSIFAKDYGVKADGITVTATVSISSGTPNLTATGATFTANDAGKIIFVEGAGTTGGWLQSTILTFTDATHVVLNNNAATTVSAASKRVIYGSDDGAAITVAISAAANGPYTLWFTDGTMLHSTVPNWAFNHLHVKFLSDDATFIYTGAGNTAHSFSGMANYPGTQGCVDGRFGLPGFPILRGNPKGTTNKTILFDNYHFGVIAARPRDAGSPLAGQDTGIVGASAVCTDFYIRISNNSDGAFIFQPSAAVAVTAAVACTWHDLVVEGCGTGGQNAVQLTGCINNSFRGGTIESNLAGGLIEDSTCSRNTYINVDLETNGTAADWIFHSKYPVLINCSGAATTSGQVFASVGATVIGGKFQSATITDTTLFSTNVEWITAFTNSASATNTIMYPQGVGTPTATFTGQLKTNSAGGGIGYATGSGGAVTQLTSKSTGVTLNTSCGQITMNNAALLNGVTATFTLTNSTIVATDVVAIAIKSGAASAGSYFYWIDSIAAGSCVIAIRNISAGSLSEAIVFNFAIVKSVNS